MELINYYFKPGNIYYLVKFAQQYNSDLSNLELRSFLQIIIKENHYTKDLFMNNIVFNLVECYFRKLTLSVSKKIFEKYSYFLKRISDTKNFNIEEEYLLMEFKEQILDG